MLCVNESGNAALLLALRNGVDGQCSLTRRLGTEYLYDTASRESTYP